MPSDVYSFSTQKESAGCVNSNQRRLFRSSDVQNVKMSSQLSAHSVKHRTLNPTPTALSGIPVPTAERFSHCVSLAQSGITNTSGSQWQSCLGRFEHHDRTVRSQNSVCPEDELEGCECVETQLKGELPVSGRSVVQCNTLQTHRYVSGQSDRLTARTDQSNGLRQMIHQSADHASDHSQEAAGFCRRDQLDTVVNGLNGHSQLPGILKLIFQ